MRSSPVRGRPGLSFIEIIVVVAMIGVLAALLLPAVQKIRENGYRTECLSNLRQLGLAFTKFDYDKGTLPPYFGEFGTTDPKPLGSWFLHLMPYVEEGGPYNAMQDDMKASGSNYYTSVAPPVGPDGSPVWLAVALGLDPVLAWNGHGAVPSNNPPATHWPLPPANTKWHGIWWLQQHPSTFKLLQCPSDPSTRKPPMDLNNQWSTTCYVANWHVFSVDEKDVSQLGQPNANQMTNPNPNPWSATTRSLMNGIPDGQPRTVLLAEAYANCDQQSRAALANPEYWAFGIDWYGNKNTNLFQVRPQLVNSTKAATIENSGSNYCNNYTTQTAHSGMHVLLCDSSARVVNGHINAGVWTNLVLPNDAGPLDDNWQVR